MAVMTLRVLAGGIICRELLERRVLPVSASMIAKALAVKHSHSSWAKAGQTAARTIRLVANAINRRYPGKPVLLEGVILPMMLPLFPRYTA
jgi:hypothetical protein